MLRYILTALLLIVCETLCCETPSFQNARVTVFRDENDLVGQAIIVTGCLGPVPQIVENSRIECKYQNINVLHKDAVANLTASTITFNNNGLEKVEPGAFASLDMLSTLDMNGNKIEEVLAGVFSPLIALEKLSLENNRITKIERAAFSNMANLKELFLKDNQITNWDNSWFRNNFALKKINLNENLITYIPEDAIKGLKQLRDIHLGKNRISDINPRAFSATDQLYILDLSENRLKKLHPDLFASFGVKEEPTPRPGNNRFVSVRIRNAFAGVQNLYLHRNNLTFLPEKLMNDLSVNTNIFYINLHSNPWQCACYSIIERWAQRRRASIDIFNIGCVDKKNPLCVVSNTPDQCVEAVDEEIYPIYYSQYKEVSEIDRFDRDVRCF